MLIFIHIVTQLTPNPNFGYKRELLSQHFDEKQLRQCLASSYVFSNSLNFLALHKN